VVIVQVKQRSNGHEDQATRHNVEAWQTATIFDGAGSVIYSGGQSLEDASTTAELDEIGRILIGEDANGKMIITLNGQRSSWYVWDGQMFVCEA